MSSRFQLHQRKRLLVDADFQTADAERHEWRYILIIIILIIITMCIILCLYC